MIDKKKLPGFNDWNKFMEDNIDGKDIAIDQLQSIIFALRNQADLANHKPTTGDLRWNFS